MLVCYGKVTRKSVDVLYRQGLNFREKNPPEVGFQQLHTICKRAGGCIYVCLDFRGCSSQLLVDTEFLPIKVSKNSKEGRKKTALLFNDKPLAVFLNHEHPLLAHIAHDAK